MARTARVKTARRLPTGVREVAAPWPLEISGVAAVPGGYLVVGDEDPKYGRIWPGGGRFALPAKLKGPESVAWAAAPSGETLCLVLGEKKRRLVDLQGGSCKLSKDFAEEHGRGCEGLALRWDETSGAGWQAAVAWEGGFYDWDSPRKGEVAAPRIALLPWLPGKKQKMTTEAVITLELPQPSAGQRFRVPDLAWDGEGFLVLLASTDRTRKKRAHTWIQRFDLDGKPDGTPLKLEKAWGRYRDGKNWEALDRTFDGTGLVLGHDERDSEKHRALAVFNYP